MKRVGQQRQDEQQQQQLSCRVCSVAQRPACHSPALEPSNGTAGLRCCVTGQQLSQPAASAQLVQRCLKVRNTMHSLSYFVLLHLHSTCSAAGCLTAASSSCARAALYSATACCSSCACCGPCTSSAQEHSAFAAFTPASSRSPPVAAAAATSSDAGCCTCWVWQGSTHMCQDTSRVARRVPCKQCLCQVRHGWQWR